MDIKTIVDTLLTEKDRPMTWLAEQIGRTYDGLRLSLIKKTIKYSDIVKMAKVLEVEPRIFFEGHQPVPYKETPVKMLHEEEIKYTDLKSSLKNCKEMVSTLKDQLKDKEKIISLMNK
jgi:hypothetical protein